MKPFVLGIIPARGGSKRIPDKNIIALAGQPLISYTTEAARKSCRLDDLLVSTDSDAIAEIVRGLGVKVPFRRPDEFSTDAASTSDVLINVVEEYETLSGRAVDIIVTLQPTQPLRSAGDIDQAVALLDTDPGAESVITCYKADSVRPEYMYFPVEGRVRLLMEGPNKDEIYIRNGAVYVTRRRLLMEDRKIMEEHPMCYIMPRERSFNIDEPFDLELCEAFLRYKSNE